MYAIRSYYEAHGLTPVDISTDESSNFSLGAKQLGMALARYPDLDGIICTNRITSYNVCYTKLLRPDR